MRLVDGDEAAELRAALEWPAGGAIVGFRLRIEPNGGAKPTEVIEALTGAEPPEGARYARLAMWALRDERADRSDGLDALRAAPVMPRPSASPRAPAVAGRRRRRGGVAGRPAYSV